MKKRAASRVPYHRSMDQQNVDALIAAISSGDLRAVRAALESQPELAKVQPIESPSPLLVAAYYGRRDVANALIEAGAPVGICEAAALGLHDRAAKLMESDSELASSWSADGFQPLGLAAYFGHAGVARLLLENGAPINSASRNAQSVMPIHSAVAAKSKECIELLLARGADVDAPQQQGYRPIHAAAKQGSDDVIALLLQAGADPCARSDHGETAAELARRAGHESIAKNLDNVCAEGAT